MHNSIEYLHSAAVYGTVQYVYATPYLREYPVQR